MGSVIVVSGLELRAPSREPAAAAPAPARPAAAAGRPPVPAPLDAAPFAPVPELPLPRPGNSVRSGVSFHGDDPLPLLPLPLLPPDGALPPLLALPLLPPPDPGPLPLPPLPRFAPPVDPQGDESFFAARTAGDESQRQVVWGRVREALGPCRGHSGT